MKGYNTKRSEYKQVCVSLQMSSKKIHPLIENSLCHVILSEPSTSPVTESSSTKFYAFSLVSSFELSFLLNSTKYRIDGILIRIGGVEQGDGWSTRWFPFFIFDMICRGIVFIENESTARKIRSWASRTRVDHGGIGLFAMTSQWW